MTTVRRLMDALEAERERQGMTYKELAERSTVVFPVQESTVRNYLRNLDGAKIHGYEYIEGMCKALGLTIRVIKRTPKTGEK